MELQKLRQFYAVAKYQHVTKAAAELYIAQPSLTQSIASLEKELGVPLFVKRGRNIVLTEYGEYLKKRLDALLPELDAIPDELQNIKSGVSKRIRLNILAASTFVLSAIVAYRKSHPDAVFDFEQSAEKQNCDIVITTNVGRKKAPANYAKRFVLEERIFLAVPRDSVYGKLESITLSEVKDEEFVMLSGSRLFGVICNQLCSVAGFSPKVMFESDSPSAVQNIISTGAGIAFWPEYSCGKLNNDSVKLLNVTAPDCRRELIAELYDTGKGSSFAEDFYEFLVSEFSEK
jgi:DNA-binding transcriptional LysR family regulator